MLKLETKNAAPIMALTAIGAIALAALIADGRAGDRQRAPEDRPRVAALEAQSVTEDAGDFAVGQTDAPAVEAIHSVLAAVDAERFPKGLVAAHATLPLGTWARFSNLSTGQNVTARVTARPADESSYVLTLSADVADGLGLARDVKDLAVMVEPLDGGPSDSRLLAFRTTYDPDSVATGSLGSHAQPELEKIANASRYLEFGSFDRPEDAERMLQRLKMERLTDGRFGGATIVTIETPKGAAWRVSLGPVMGWSKAIEAQRAARDAGLIDISVVRR